MSDSEATSMIERYGGVAKRPIQQWIEYSETSDTGELSNPTDELSDHRKSKVKTASESGIANR